MSRHEGVSCDSCMRQNFAGDRFKCLKCFDFDLCRQCFETERFGASSEHTSDHPVQCVLTKDDFDFTYWGEPASSEELRNMTFTCPYCANMGNSMANLYEHIRTDHMDTNYEVICPVCVATPQADPNRLTDDLVSHLAAEHINRTGRSSTDDSTAAQMIAAQTVNGASRLQRRLISGGGNGARQVARRGRPLGLLATAAVAGQAAGQSSAAQRSQQYNDAIAELLAQTQQLTRRTGQPATGASSANDIYQVLNQQISSRRQRSRQLIANVAEDLDDIALFENMLLRDPGLAELYTQALSTSSSGSQAPSQHVPVIVSDPSQAASASNGRQPRSTPFLSALNPAQQTAQVFDAASVVQDLVTELVPENDDIAALWPDGRYLTARHLRQQQSAAAESEGGPLPVADQARLLSQLLTQLLQLRSDDDDESNDDNSKPDDGSPPAAP